MADGTTKPIAHATRSLLPVEKYYTQIEKEALSIIFAISKFHHFASKKGLPTYTANKFQRCGTLLLTYNFKMEYTPSNSFGHVDGLSRLITKYREQLVDAVIVSLQAEDELKTFICNSIRELLVRLEQINREAFRGKYINNIKAKI